MSDQNDPWQDSDWIGGAPPDGEPASYAPGEIGRWLRVDARPGEVRRFVRRFDLPANAAVAEARVVLASSDTTAGLAEWKANTPHLPRFAYQTTPGGPAAVEGEAATFLRPGSNVVWLEARRAVGGAQPFAVAEPFAVACGLRGVMSDGATFEIGTDGEWTTDVVSAADHPVSNGGLEEMLEDGDPPAGGSPVLPDAVGDAAVAPRFFPPPRGASRLRLAFALDRPARRATLRVATLGWSEAHLDGEKLGDAVLDPAPTAYDERCFSVAHDVTDRLGAGDHAIGVELADGWYGQDRAWWPTVTPYGPPRVRAALDVEFADGTTRRIATGPDWRAAAGPVTRSNVYAGEDHDGRIAAAQVGWASAGFDDAAWSPVAVGTDPTEGAGDPSIEPQAIPPCRVIRRLRPVAESRPFPGVRVYDFGENLAGWCRLSASLPPGTVAVLRFAEALHPDGTVDDLSTGVRATRVAQLDRFTFVGGGLETFEPRYAYHGFRHAQLTGVPDGAAVEIDAAVVHNDVADAGGFDCSDGTINGVLAASRRSYLGNLHGLLTDCPHRERCAWHADLELACDFGLLAHDTAAVYAKSIDDTLHTLDGRGLPFYISCGRRLHPPTEDLGWASVVGQVPLRVWRYAGDDGPMRRAYPTLRRVLDDALSSLDGGGLMPGAAWGDHAAPSLDADGGAIAVCPKPLYATLVLVELLRCAARSAGVIGEDAAPWIDADARVSAALVRAGGPDGFGHQTADAAALLLGLHPPGGGAALARSLRENVARHDGLNVGGFWGYRRIAEAMLRFAPAAEAIGTMTSDRFPGVPWSLRHDGATSLYEYFWPPGTTPHRERSRNHPPFGAVCETCWRLIAGIDPHPDATGFDRLVMRPHGVGPLTRARAWHDSPRGRVESSWSLDAGRVRWSVALPPGTTATVAPPAGLAWVDGSPADLGPGRHELAAGEIA